MRRRDVIGLCLLVPGFVTAYAAFVTLGNRVFPTATVARTNGMDHAEVYFLGVEGGSVADLSFVLGWALLGLIGIALIAAGYRLITRTPDEAPPERAVDVPAVWHRFDV